MKQKTQKKYINTTKSLFLLSIMIICFISCKKEYIAPGICLVKTSTITNLQNGSIITSEYEYDSMGRLIHKEDPNVTNYIWDTDSLTIYRFNYNNDTISFDTIVYYLNSQGQAISGPDGWLHSYDSDGFLINEETDLGHTVTSFTYTNGNMINSIKTTDTETISFTYEYDTKKIDNRNYGLDLFNGKNSKNLRTSVTFWGDKYDYTYEYDSKYRVTKQTLSDISITYTYFD